jgi:hypothetical protein
MASRVEETPPVPAQETGKLQGKNVHTHIAGPVCRIQKLGVGSDKDVIMDEIDASTTELDGEQTQEEVKTSPKTQTNAL